MAKWENTNAHLNMISHFPPLNNEFANGFLSNRIKHLMVSPYKFYLLNLRTFFLSLFDLHFIRLWEKESFEEKSHKKIMWKSLHGFAKNANYRFNRSNNLNIFRIRSNRWKGEIYRIWLSAKQKMALKIRFCFLHSAQSKEKVYIFFDGRLEIANHFSSSNENSPTNDCICYCCAIHLPFAFIFHC